MVANSCDKFNLKKVLFFILIQLASILYLYYSYSNLYNRAMPELAILESACNKKFFDQLNFLKQQVQKKFHIVENSEIYLSLHKSEINTCLLVLFGNKQFFKNNLFENQNTNGLQKKLQQNFKEIRSLRQKQKMSMNQNIIIKTIQSKNFQQILQKKELLNKITPQFVSKNNENCYFKLQQHEDQWLTPKIDEKDKNVLVIPFNQDQLNSNITLCFYQTKQNFSIKQIEAIFNKYQGQQQNLQENICQSKVYDQQEEFNLQEELKNKEQKDKEQKIQEEQSNLPKEYEEEKYWQDKTTLFFLAFIFIVFLLFMNTFAIDTNNLNGQIRPQDFTQFHLSMINYKKQVQAKIIEPLRGKSHHLTNYINFHQILHLNGLMRAQNFTQFHLSIMKYKKQIQATVIEPLREKSHQLSNYINFHSISHFIEEVIEDATSPLNYSHNQGFESEA